LNTTLVLVVVVVGVVVVVVVVVIICVVVIVGCYFGCLRCSCSCILEEFFAHSVYCLVPLKSVFVIKS